MSMTEESWKRDMARLKNFDIIDDEHGGLGMGGYFQFEGACCQGLGYRIDIEFVQKLMAVFQVKRLQDVNGMHAWVTHSRSDVNLVEPLMEGEGKPFNIHEWSKEARARSGACKSLEKSLSS